MKEDASSLELTLSFLFDGVSQDIRTWNFPTQGSLAKTLENEILPIAMARMLTEASPTGRMYRHSQEPFSFDPLAEILPLPTNLFIYALFYDKKRGLWEPRFYARIKATDKDGDDEAGGKFHYILDNSYRSLKSGKRYWARSLDSKERQEKYRKAIAEALQGKQGSPPLTGENKPDEKSLFSELLGSFKSSYAGVRFGKSVLASDSLVSRVNMISILAEIGAGPLAGLRWYYDLFPEVKRGSGSEEENFGLRRAQLGWAFNFEMPNALRPLADKIDVQPKIGLLDLKSHSYAPTSNGKVGVDFNVKNTFDLALEVGAEKHTHWFRSRLWGAFSSANLGLSNESAVSVKSSRGGMDLYFAVFQSGNWNMNLLTFATLEHLEISKDPKAIGANSPGIYSISTNLIFAGLGFTVSW